MAKCKEKECPSFGKKKTDGCGCNRDDVTITVTMSLEKAQAYAQFLKRASFSSYREHAADAMEAYTMTAAGDTIRYALAKSGFAPRSWPILTIPG